MVKNFFDKIANRTRIGFLAAFVLLVVSYILTYISTKRVIVQDYWIKHTNEVIHDLDNLVGNIIRAESSFRGYLLTKNTTLLDQFGQSEIDTYNNFRTLQKLTSDNGEQQKNLDTLHALIDKKFIIIRKNIEDFAKNKNILAAPALEQEVFVPGTQVENYVRKMQATEKKLWDQRSKKVTEYSDFIRVLNIISIVVAILLTVFSIMVYNKEYRAKRQADKKAAEYSEQLQHRVEQLAELNEELIDLRSVEKYAVTGRIARTMAHEVRNPLTNINLATEQLLAEMEPTDTTKLLFGMISRNSERINQLVSDLLNTTRVADLSFTQISISDLINESLQLATDRIELNQIKVVKKFASDVPKISVDVSKMKIAFLNIFVNAIEAMKTGGVLTIETLVKNNRCVIKISDNGNGMSKEQMGRLFEPYFTTKEKGNGLGLANTQNIILAHNGNISAESKLGEGTTFSIFLRFQNPTNQTA